MITMSALASYSLGTGPSMPLTSPALSQIADGPPHEIDSAALDYLLIEIVESFRASAMVAYSRFKQVEEEMIVSGLLPESIKKSKAYNHLEDADHALLKRLDTAGRHVGSNLSERLTRDRPRFQDPLDAIKFVCKDVWIACWGKQVDNLRTNHRGVYIIQDSSFRPLKRISSWESQEETLLSAKMHIEFATGIIRGVIQRLGLTGTITADPIQPPQCGFQIKLSK